MAEQSTDALGWLLLGRCTHFKSSNKTRETAAVGSACMWMDLLCPRSQKPTEEMRAKSSVWLVWAQQFCEDQQEKFGGILIHAWNSRKSYQCLSLCAFIGRAHDPHAVPLLHRFHDSNRKKINTMCCFICLKVSVWIACACKYLCLTITLYYWRVECNRAPQC